MPQLFEPTQDRTQLWGLNTIVVAAIQSCQRGQQLRSNGSHPNSAEADLLYLERLDR